MRTHVRPYSLIAATSIATVMLSAISPAAQAGSVIRVWGASIALDNSFPIRQATAARGDTAAVAWSSGGRAYVSIREAGSASWADKVDLGTTTSLVDVAVGADSTVAVVKSTVDSGPQYTPEVRWRPAGQTTWRRGALVSTYDASEIESPQVAVGPTGAVVVAWKQPGATGVVQIATPTGRNSSLEVTSAPPMSVEGYRLFTSGDSATIVWSELGPKPGTRVLARSLNLRDFTWSPEVVVSGTERSATSLDASMAPDGTIVAAFRATPVLSRSAGIYTATRSTAGTWAPATLVTGTGAGTRIPSVAASNGGGATLAFSEGSDASLEYRVVDRKSASTGWSAPTTLPYILGAASTPAGPPLVARGVDGTGVVSWSGYGATNGAITSFVGQGTTWKSDGGIYSDDSTAAAEPQILADGTAIVVGGVRDSILNNLWALRVVEGRLTIAGPVAARPAAIVGSAKVGVRLKCIPPMFAPLPSSVSFRWYATGKIAPVSTSPAFAPTAAILGKALHCQVTATTTTGPTAGSTTVLSAPVVIGWGAAPSARSGSVAILGTPRVGSALRCSTGVWSPRASYRFVVTWTRTGATIPRATTTTYRPVAADRRKLLSCNVIASRSGYQPGSAASRAVKVR